MTSSLHPRFGGLATLGVAALAVVLLAPAAAAGQASGSDDVTFTRDIVPILQRSCQSCHRPNSLAPMSLITYDEVRPWARSIKNRTALRNRMGAMPPWFLERDVGIQAIKEDMSLTEEEITAIARWVDNGAPRGNPDDSPPPLEFAGPGEWEMGEPDLVVVGPSASRGADEPDWWGALPAVETGLTEDRYVKTLQVKEVGDSARTIGGRFIFHHAFFALIDEDGNQLDNGDWPTIHDLRNNPRGFTFDPEAGRFVPGNSRLQWDDVHLHSNGEDTTAHLEIAFQFHPRGYEPTKRIGRIGFGTADIDVLPNQDGQVRHFYQTLQQNVKLTMYAPHMHAAGVRMCLEAIWGGRVETLNCAGYDHNWLRYYRYEEDAMPLLPKGTILHGIGYFDSTAANPNVIDPRNWTGFGHRAVDNMLLVLAPAFILSDEEFEAEIAARRERLQLTEGDTVIGCPLCGFEELPGQPARPAADQQ